MRRFAICVLAAVVILLVCVPLAFVVTIALLPLWSWIEAAYGLESVGHSGPADWCFWLIYALLAALSLAGALLIDKKAS